MLPRKRIIESKAQILDLSATTNGLLTKIKGW